MKHKEIASLLNISEGTSKSNLNRAKSNLQKKILALMASKDA
jgi:RNA polymerase sigma-70 factor (ECF subfamily)